MKNFKEAGAFLAVTKFTLVIATYDKNEFECVWDSDKKEVKYQPQNYKNARAYFEK